MRDSDDQVASTDEFWADQKAKDLLATIRRTPMLRGGRISEQKRSLQTSISAALEAESVLPRLAQRIAFQLVLKVDVADLGDPSVWRAVGQRVCEEAERLKNGVGLVERQIVVALPKLSSAQIEELLEELRARDPNIARTILNVALDAAEPITAAQRYLAEYHRVAAQLKHIDPRLARTLANATFMAHSPRTKAMDHFKQFADLVSKFQDDVEFVRTLARAAFRAPEPLKAARGFIADYEAILAELVSDGVEVEIARTVAGIASLAANPRAAATKLLESFDSALKLAKKTHPSVARSIALSACRAADPLTTARMYMDNYDTIVRAISRIDPRRAHVVAAQAFRSSKPLRWANRFLTELQSA